MIDKNVVNTARYLSERSLLVCLHISKFWSHRRDPVVTTEVLNDKNAGKDAGQFVKNLLPADAMATVNEVISRSRIKHNYLTKPWQDQGWRILASQQYLRYQMQMKDLREEFFTSVDSFCLKYPTYVADAPLRLKGLWSADDFPSVDEVKESFGFTLSYLPVPTGEDFRVNLPDAQIKDLQDQLEEQVQNTIKKAQEDLYGRLKAPLMALATRLKDPEKSFKAALFTNLQEVVESLPGLMTEDDTHLLALAKEASDTLGVLEPQEVRDNLKLREQAAKAADDLLARMSAYMPSISVTA